LLDSYFMEKLKSSNKALIIGIGGGGDVLGTIPTRNLLNRFNIKSNLASLTYERFIYDPIPGPRKLEDIVNIEKINKTIAIANRNTKAKDGLEFQATKMSKFLSEEIFLIDINAGVKGITDGLKDLIKKFDFDILFGIDVGGDVVAYGNEKGLRSPLTDAIMLSSLNNLPKKTIIGVYGIGCDGELTINEISKRFSNIYSDSGFIGSIPLSFDDAKVIEEGSKLVNTEASKLPILVTKGKTGSIKIRDGLRNVNLSFFSIFTYYFKTKVVFNNNRAAKAISNSNSFLEANEILRKLNITTEYDLQLIKKGLKSF
jgi:hypothetical protein